jgi:quinol monooxygenase YgiN
MTKVQVIATLVAKEDRLEEFKQFINELIENTKSEPNTTVYDVYQHAEKPNEFHFVEEYNSKEDFDNHTGYLKSKMDILQPLLASAPTIIPLKKFASASK